MFEDNRVLWKGATLAVGAVCWMAALLGPSDGYAAPGGASGVLFSASTQLMSPPGQTFGFETEVSGAGDVNGDGFDDVVVGTGTSAHLFSGSATGIVPTASWSVNRPSGSRYGATVAGAGDVNGDGYDDVVVGEPDLRVSEGKVYLYLGSSSGLSSNPAWTVSEDVKAFGSQVASAGDVNADGYDDVLVSTTGAVRSWRDSINNTCKVGTAFLYLGSASGLSSQPDWQYSSTEGNCFGYTIASAGDVDNDGYDDVIFGAMYDGWSDDGLSVWGKGLAVLFRGTASGLEATPSWSQVHPGGVEGAVFGIAVSGAGDVNNDGFDDVLVRGYALFSEGDAPMQVVVFFGSPTGLKATPNSTIDQTILGDRPHRMPVAGVGDADADGFDDILVSDFAPPPLSSSLAESDFFHGSSSGLVSPAAWTKEAQPSGAGVNAYGHDLAGAGDVNADGFDDIVLTNNYREVFVHYGGPNPSPVALPQSLTTSRGTPLDVTLTADDPYGDPLSFSVDAEPTHGHLDALVPRSGQMTYVPDGDFVGVDSFSFVAADPYGNTDTASVEVSVTQEAPVFVAPTPDEPLRVEVGDELTFTAAADDPEGDSVVYTLSPQPPGADFDVLSGEFRWTPTAAQVGEWSLELFADDGYATTSHTVVIDVTAPDEGDPTADAGDAGIDVDPPDDADADDDSELDAGHDAGDDTGAPDGAPNGASVTDEGCGCTSSSGPSSGLMALVVALAVLGLRRRWGGGGRA